MKLNGVRLCPVSDRAILAILPPSEKIGNAGLVRAGFGQRYVSRQDLLNRLENIAASEQWTQGALDSAQAEVVSGAYEAFYNTDPFKCVLGIVVGAPTEASKYHGELSFGDVVLVSQNAGTIWHGLPKTAARMLGPNSESLCVYDETGGKCVQLKDTASISIVDVESIPMVLIHGKSLQAATAEPVAA